MTRPRWWLVICSALLLFASALPAHATDYYVSATGTGTACTAGAPCPIAVPNLLAVGGDNVFMRPGNYLIAPNPLLPMVAGQWVHYYGDVTNPSLVKIAPAVTLTDSALSIRGVEFRSGLSIGNACRWDSLMDCIVDGTFELAGPDYNVFARNIFHSPTFWIARTNIQYAIGNSFFSNIWDRLGVGYTGGGNVMMSGVVTGTPGNASLKSYQDSSTYMFNKFTVLLEASGDPTSHAREHYGMLHSLWRGNRWDITNNLVGGRWGALILRDSSLLNRMVSDTIFQGGPGTCNIQLSGSGSIGKSCSGNIVDSCYFKVKGCPAIFQDGMITFTGRRNIWVGRANGLSILQARGRNYLDHNTIVGVDNGSGVVNGDTSWPGWVDQTIFTNNIVAQLAAESAPTNSCPNQSNYRSAFFVSIRVADSTFFVTEATHSAHLRSEGNLYAYYGTAIGCSYPNDTVGVRSILLQWQNGDRGQRPGTNTAWTTKWCVGCDDSSYYGSPWFRDSIFATFDPTITTPSQARSHDLAGGDIGALPFAGYPVIQFSAPAYFTDEGSAQTWDVGIFNFGTTVLSVSHMTPQNSSGGSTPLLTASQDTLSVGVGAVGFVTLTFTPTGTGTAPGLLNLGIESNDGSGKLVYFPCYINNPGGSPPRGDPGERRR